MSAGAEMGALHLSDRKMARESECGGCGVKHAGVRPRVMGAIGGFQVERAYVCTPRTYCHCTKLKATRLVSGLDLVTHWPCDLQ